MNRLMHMLLRHAMKHALTLQNAPAQKRVSGTAQTAHRAGRKAARLVRVAQRLTKP